MSKFESRSECANAMNCKGREYFVTGYTRGESMPDKETEELFDRAENLYYEFQEAVDNLAVAFGLPTKQD